MGATLGSALQSHVALSATRPSSSPWKATLWSPQAMWIPPEQGEAGMSSASPAATVKVALAAETTTVITHGLWR